jgi:hypothetical protein
MMAGVTDTTETDGRTRRPRTSTADLRSLVRIRWAVRGTLALGVVASTAANVLHAEPHPVSRVIASWPPLALLLTIELISRVPVHRRSLAVVRVLATVAIAGIAAWVSYWHMAGVVARYGETGAAPYLLPLSVDGLVAVASVCLVELGARITEARRTPTAVPARPVAVPPPYQPTGPAPDRTPVPAVAYQPVVPPPAITAEPDQTTAEPPAVPATTPRTPVRRTDQPTGLAARRSDDDAVLARLREWRTTHGRTPSLSDVQTIAGGGRPRAVRLRDKLADSDQTTDDTDRAAAAASN